MILQGHKLKNPKMQLVQKVKEVPAALRIIISGTPIQNNLMEMHALYDIACPVSAHDTASGSHGLSQKVGITSRNFTDLSVGLTASMDGTIQPEFQESPR